MDEAHTGSRVTPEMWGSGLYGGMNTEKHILHAPRTLWAKITKWLSSA